MSERRQADGYVTHGELRQVEKRWRERFARLDEALDFYDRMCELGLRELLPVILRSERTRQALGALREGRYHWALRTGAYLLPLSYVVALVGGGLAIARTLGWIH